MLDRLYSLRNKLDIFMESARLSEITWYFLQSVLDELDNLIESLGETEMDDTILYTTQGGGRCAFDEELNRWIFTTPVPPFDIGNPVPEDWGVQEISK